MAKVPRMTNNRVVDTRPPWSVGIVGGGISGLSAAHFLSRAGAEVVIYESSTELGGLATFFEFEDQFFDSFYHCLLPSDDALLGLIRELGIEDRVYWKPSYFGVVDSDRIHPLNTPLDLLRFPALSPVDRLRVGWTGLYASRCSSDGLDSITTAEWLARHCGSRAYTSFFKPMLEAKFGEYADRIPALWFWTRFNREKSKKEVKGYITGGYKGLAESIAEAITARGAMIEMETLVRSVDIDDDGRPRISIASGSRSFDQVLLTTPMPLVASMLDDGPLRERIVPRMLESDSVGVVNFVVLLRRKLSDFYWIATPEPSYPFQGAVQTTALIDPKDSHGHHIVHLMNYAHRSAPVFDQDEASIRSSHLDALARLFPDLAPADVHESFLFKAPFVEPIYQPNYLAERRPPDVLLPGKVFLATTAQVYPDVTSWNGSTQLTKRVTETMIQGRS